MFGALYLVPIVAGAVWLGARTAVGLAVGSAAYVVHARTAWVGDVDVERAAQRTAIVQAIATLSGALRQRDDGTAAHSERSPASRSTSGKHFASSPRASSFLASLVHDVGKIGVRFEARVLRVADVYAALVELRPYMHPLARADALARMKQLAGKLDGAALEALERLVGEGTLEVETGFQEARR